MKPIKIGLSGYRQWLIQQESRNWRREDDLPNPIQHPMGMTPNELNEFLACASLANKQTTFTF